MYTDSATEIREDNQRYNFEATLKKYDLRLPPISIETMWVNITRLCNQACSHCHVDASPNRTEHMSRSVIDGCLEILAKYDTCKNLDITGGAPELNPNFDYFVVAARKLNKHVLVRHNLTVVLDGNPLTDESKTYLPEFFAENQVEVLASLPHYDKCLTDRVRGPGAFEKSIEVIRRLNAVGYGRSGEELVLNLVHNCDGPLSPADRLHLEVNFRQELLSQHDLTFNKLFTVTNMPINRFRWQLKQSDTYDSYMRRLVEAFSDSAAREIACRSLISVSYDGQVYDCDFNQMLGMQSFIKAPVNIFNCDFDTLLNRKIRFASHCFGCTAGGGSS